MRTSSNPVWARFTAACASRSSGSSNAPRASERAMIRPRASITSTAICRPPTGLSSAPGLVRTPGAETASSAACSARLRSAWSSEPCSCEPTTSTVAVAKSATARTITPAAASTSRVRSETLCAKRETGTPHSLDQRRVSELAPQACDVAVDNVRLGGAVPDLGDRQLPRDELSGGAQQDLEQLRLPAGQLECLSAA